jgi:hypothetical protein
VHCSFVIFERKDICAWSLSIRRSNQGPYCLLNETADGLGVFKGLLANTLFQSQDFRERETGHLEHSDMALQVCPTNLYTSPSPSPPPARGQPALKQVAFQNILPKLLKCALRPCFPVPAADSLGMWTSHMFHTADGGVANRANECARLLNVTSVDCVGRPMQCSTINLSQMC